MKEALARFNEWYAQLAPRERWMVLACAGVVAFAILFAGIWDPLVKAHRERAEAVDGARALAQRIEQLAALAQRGAAAANVNRSMSLAAAVDQASRSGTLAKPPRIQPEGESEVRVWLEDIPFESVLRWLAELEARYGIQAKAADIERESAPGLVNARLTLARP